MLAILSGCATRSVDLEQPRRLLGTDAGVRLDAEIASDQLSPERAIAVRYDITNLRSTPIAVAELIPETTYDPETQTITIGLGSEVPGVEFLPRLAVIGPGQKKSFAQVASFHFLLPGSPSTNPFGRYPRALRVRLNFLGDIKPFERLIDIQERAVHDPRLADELFAKWIEKNETVDTNALPMHWVAPPPNPVTGR
jgi:hypothetical protein